MAVERSIIFSGEMVRAILEGRKGQSRRVIKPQFSKTWGYGVRNQDPEYFSVHVDIKEPDGNWRWLRCPYGKKGSRLWVRETWRKGLTDNGLAVEYRADGARTYLDDYPDKSSDWYWLPDMPWRPSIFMPRWASRLTLEVTEVRVQRVQDISEADAIAEGVWTASPDMMASHVTKNHIGAFRLLWDSINGDRPGCAWSNSPWVWAISFKRVPQPT